MHSCYLFLISSASVRSLTFLSFIVPIFGWSIPMVSPIFLKRSIFFTIYCFPLILALFTYEDFLISPCYSLEVCISLSISFPFLFAVHFSSFSQLFSRPPHATTLPSHICFSWGWFWPQLPIQCYTPSIVLQAIRPNPLNLFFISTV